MSIGNVDDFRSILSENFEKVLDCLFPMATVGIPRSGREEDYLENLRTAATRSKDKAKSLAKNLRGSIGCCSFEIDGVKTHKGVWVDYQGATTPCEIGDVMVVSKFVDSHGVLSRNVSFLQAKVDEKTKSQTWDIDPTQLQLYKNWPLIRSCYTRSGHKQYPLLPDFQISHTDRWFSSYLLVIRGCVFSSVTSTDLIASACRKTNTIHGPLELPFLSLLVQLLFQTAGEQDTSTHVQVNATLATLVDKILKHVRRNDPIVGKGRPFIVIRLTVRGEFERR